MEHLLMVSFAIGNLQMLSKQNKLIKFQTEPELVVEGLTKSSDSDKTLV